MGEHLSEEQLASVLGETTAGNETQDRLDVRAHLDECAACRARLEERRSEESLFEELAGAVRNAAEEWGVGPTRALLTSDAIPGYELLGEIRRGGQGTVYLARQASTRREVALKLLSRAADAPPRNRQRFEREVDLLSRLRHPGIVCVYESGETDGRLWYSMELADGETLDEYLHKTTLDRDAKLRLFEAIAEGVAHAHRNGVIHRDLKPANILVDPEGMPRIVDFGLALAAADDAADDEERLTETGEFLGTLSYASPEQVRGVAADTRTDVHALGLLLYELLTGRLPWDTRGSVTDVLMRIEGAEPVDPRSVSRSVDSELRTILMAALAKDPRERYASADAMLRDVAHYRAQEPLEARRHNTGYVLAKALSRHRTGFALVLGALALVTVTVTTLVQGHLAQEQRAREVELARKLMKDAVGASGAMRDETTRLAILEDSVQRLDDELDASPDVRAALLLVLGESHAERLRDDAAADYLERAAARFHEAGDPSGAARALEGLAAALCQSGDPRAVEVAEEALDLRRSEGPGADETLVQRGERLVARTLMSRVPEQEDDRRRAREILQRVLGELVASLGEDDPQVAETRVLLARVMPDPAQAVELYAQALEVLERRPGEVRRTIECLNGYAGALLSEDRLVHADELLRRSTQLTQQTYGERYTVDQLRRRARIEELCGNLTGAVLLTRTALAVEVDGWVERRPEEEERLLALSQRLRDGDRPPYAETFRVLRDLRGNGDFELSAWANEVAGTLTELEHHTEAEAVLRESLNIYCRVYGLDCPNRMRTLYALADQLVRTGRTGAARIWLDELLQRSDDRGLVNERLVRQATELAERLAKGTALGVQR